MPVKNDAYFLPKLFRIYVKSKGQTTFNQAKELIFKDIDQVNLSRARKIAYPFSEWQKLRINFLGVWDTVLALGGRIITMKSRQFYLKDQPAACVDHARQALAIDERRYDFLPEIWIKPAFPEQTLIQNWFAGVHSNIGGGYTNDGLANVTLHWMINRVEAVNPNFKTKQSFLRIYRPFVKDEMIDSKTKTYKTKDFILRKNGLRNIKTTLDQGYEQSGLKVHRSVLTRIKTSPNNNRHMSQAYQPKNLMKYLEQYTEKQVFKE